MHVYILSHFVPCKMQHYELHSVYYSFQWLQILQEHQDNGGLVEVLIWHLHTSLRRMSSTSIRYYKNASKSWILFFGIKAKGLSTKYPLSDGNAVFLPMNRSPIAYLEFKVLRVTWELLQLACGGIATEVVAYILKLWFYIHIWPRRIANIDFRHFALE